VRDFIDGMYYPPRQPSGPGLSGNGPLSATQTDAIVARLRAALSGSHSLVVDVTADRTVMEISGSRSRHLLMKGCAIDLHPRSFSQGQCPQTIFSRTTVILEQTNAAPTWRPFVRSSFASYLTRWLIDAMQEYGLSHEFTETPVSTARDHFA
jgi:heterotetrameric sarcosine oxidase gamma subunit